MTEIYFDNSATTPVSDNVLLKINDVMKNYYGNPSSLHLKGYKASEILEESRKTVALELNADSAEIIFTGSGTESNNIAVLGAALSKKRRGRKIVSTSIEHPSVARCLDKLSSDGFDVVRLKADAHGNISKEQLFEAIDRDTVLVSVMYVNNEIGSILPIECIKNALYAKESQAIIHCDAVQAFGKMPIDVKNLGVDLLSCSAHKIGGPKGVGALYIKKGTTISQTVFGGGQEKGLRSGTQNIPFIAGFAEAVREIGSKQNNFMQMKALSAALKNWLLGIPGVVIHSDSNAFPSIVSFSAASIKSEVLLHFLEKKGIYVSNGAACAKGRESEVMRACGIADDLIKSAVRVSFSHKNTISEVSELISAIKDAKQKLCT